MHQSIWWPLEGLYYNIQVVFKSFGEPFQRFFRYWLWWWFLVWSKMLWLHYVKQYLLQITEREFGVFLENAGDLAWVNFLFLLESVFSEFKFGRWFVRRNSVKLQVKDQGVLASADAAEHELEVLVKLFALFVARFIPDHWKSVIKYQCLKFSTFKSPIN